MPTRACNICKLNFPYRTEYEQCPGCGEKTGVLLTTDLPSDWETRVKDYFVGMADSHEEGDRIVAYRLGRLRTMGYGWDEAAELAGAYFGPEKVDIAYVEKLVEDGATLKQAARLA